MTDEERVARLVKNRGFVKAVVVHLDLGLSVGMARYHLQHLEAAGRIVGIGKTRARVWFDRDEYRRLMATRKAPARPVVH